MLVRNTWFVLVLARLLASSLALAAAPSRAEFNPITENVSFRALFKVVRYSNNKFQLKYNVYEQYDHKLKSASIWLEAFEDELFKRRKFVFTGDSPFDIELPADKLDSLVPDELTRVDKGYDLNVDKQYQLQDTFKSIRLLASIEPLDELLMGFGGTNKSQFELSAYLREDCKQKIKDRLNYIRGLSRLFQFLECLRGEFVSSTKGARKESLRDTRVMTYLFDRGPNSGPVAKSFKSMSTIKRVYCQVGSDNLNLEGTRLPARSIPLHIQFEFEDKIEIYIEVYQFEVTDTLAGANRADFLIPPGRGHSQLITSNLYQRSDHERTIRDQMRNGYSFRATLSGPSIPLMYPLELLVAYDPRRQTLAYQKSTISDLIRAAGGQQRSVVREVYDGQATMRFHIMHSSPFQIVLPVAGPRYPGVWKDCVVDALSNFHVRELDSGHSEIFNPVGAILMGYAPIRGTLCRVYERQVYGLPPWLGLGESVMPTMSHGLNSTPPQLHATFYMALQDLNSDAHAADGGRLMRIEVRTLQRTESGNRLLHMFQADIFSFRWSSVLTSESYDKTDLFDVTADCLLADLNLRHLELKLDLTPLSPVESHTQSKLMQRFRESEKLRREATSRMLSNSAFEISMVQQADLKCWLIANDKFVSHLTVHELPQVRTSVHVLGFALDLSTYNEEFGVWSIGAISSSLQECQNRAAHSLDLNLLTGQTEEVNQPFMYCQNTMHCVLIDFEIDKTAEYNVKSIFKFPAAASPSSCLVGKIRLEDHDQRVMGRFDTFHKLTDDDRRAYLNSLNVDLKVDSYEGADRLDRVSTRITKLEISQAYDKLTTLALSKFRAFTYDPPKDVEALQVTSIAQCDQICMMHHECSSYSVCHKLFDSPNLDCLLTRINWTDETTIWQVANLLSQPDVHENPDPSIVIDLNLANGITQEVKFVKSNLCSIHPRQRTLLFKKISSPWLDEHRAAANTLEVANVNECADLCIHRASLIVSAKEELDLSDEKRGETCNKFRYSEKYKTCYLLPSYDMSKIYEHLDLENKLVKRWLKAKLLNGQLKGPKYRNSDLYELNYEQVFSNDYRNRKLDIIPSSAELIDSSRVVETPHECAGHCLRRRFCESFEVLPLVEDPTQSKLSCILNFFSGARTSAQDGPWHYEPTELAYHIMGFDWTLEEETDQSQVFIDTSRPKLPSNRIKVADVTLVDTKPVVGSISLLMLSVIVIIALAIVWRNRDSLRSMGSMWK